MKTAIFGGTFDPVHEGHINLAKQAADHLSLDQVIFVPNYISPFKRDSKVTPGEMRCEMIRLILGRHRSFRLSDYEIRMDRPCYTWDTLNHFAGIYGSDICFILGLDSLMTLDTWYRGEDIIRSYAMVTGERPGTPMDKAREKASQYRAKFGGRIDFVPLDPVDVSSHEIRNEICKGVNEALIPPEVKEYIEENGLYKD